MLFLAFLIGSMKLISTQFRERAGSDKLYHLKLLIRTTHSNISLEKNEVITISPYQMNYKAENMYEQKICTCISLLESL